MAEVFGGRYELIDPIGSGGMGDVWRVRDQRSGAVVAAKILRQSDAALLLRFVREQSVRIHHPHILVPLGWSGEDSRVLFTMPLVAGGSAATLLGDFGALPPGLVAELLRQLLDALTAVHAARLVHRDVKPGNLLLDATGTGRPHAYLSDFGIAANLDEPRWTQTGVVMGSPGYVPPEAAAVTDLEPALDLYAAGMVGASLLTGLSARAVDLAAGPPAGTPESLWAVVRALTDADPGQRPSAAEAVDRLQAPELAWTPEAIGEVEIFDHLPPLPPVPTLDEAPSPPPPAPRRRLDLIVGGVVLTLLVVGLALLAWPRPTAPVPPPATPVQDTTTGSTPTAPPSASPTTATSSTAGESSPGVSVGVVVVRVGQPCQANQVGQRSKTVAGEAVVCRDHGGHPTWDRA